MAKTYMYQPAIIYGLALLMLMLTQVFGAVNDNRWHFYALTYDGSSWVPYLDGGEGNALLGLTINTVLSTPKYRKP